VHFNLNPTIIEIPARTQAPSSAQNSKSTNASTNTSSHSTTYYNPSQQPNTLILTSTSPPPPAPPNPFFWEFEEITNPATTTTTTIEEASTPSPPTPPFSQPEDIALFECPICATYYLDGTCHCTPEGSENGDSETPLDPDPPSSPHVPKPSLYPRPNPLSLEKALPIAPPEQTQTKTMTIYYSNISSLSQQAKDYLSKPSMKKHDI